MLERAEPIYETFAGWNANLNDIRKPADLPDGARTYIARIQAITGIPVTMVGVGPERDQVVQL
jgi:adenylosuccinate synthase